MNHASLFSGIGGFDLAAEWMGWTNIFNCDIEEFPRKVLKYHFPNAKQYADIKQTDFTIHAGQVNILTGGFPCQPFSMAGKRLGKNDERHLWPEMYRAIREIKPKWIVGENVRGLLNWSDGLVLDEVYADLGNEGYEIEAFLLPAAGVNAPHKRDRVWIVANSENGGCRRRSGERCSNEGWSVLQDKQRRSKVGSETPGCSGEQFNTDTNHEGLQRGEINRVVEGIGEEREEQFTRYISSTWKDFPTQSPICGGDDGVPRELDGITISKWRTESIKAYGNAIVPQIAYRIFQAIQYVELDTNQ